MGVRVEAGVGGEMEMGRGGMQFLLVWFLGAFLWIKFRGGAQTAASHLTPPGRMRWQPPHMQQRHAA